MSNITAKAKEYLKAQLSVIPTKEDKRPALPTWLPYQSQRLKEDEVDTFTIEVGDEKLIITVI